MIVFSSILYAYLAPSMTERWTVPLIGKLFVSSNARNKIYAILKCKQKINGCETLCDAKFLQEFCSLRELIFVINKHL